MQQEQSNNEKDRKSEAQKRFEEADNAGRFAGDDADARSAREQAMQGIPQQVQAGAQDPGDGNRDAAIGNSEARRQGNQVHDLKGEAQNVNTDPEEPGRLGGNDRDAEHAREKAMEGIKQRRDE